MLCYCGQEIGSSTFDIFKLEFPIGWQISLINKLANAYLKEKL